MFLFRKNYLKYKYKHNFLFNIFKKRMVEKESEVKALTAKVFNLLILGN